MGSSRNTPTSAKGNDDGTVEILPIPPALEFPSLASSAASTKSSRDENDGRKGKTVKDTERFQKIDTTHGGPAESEEVTTPVLLQRTRHPAQPPQPPALRRAPLTDRPAPSVHPNSFKAIRRVATSEPYNALAHAIGGESDSTSSSDEEGRRLVSISSKRHKDKAKNLAGLTRRPSDDPYRKFNVGNSAYRTKGHVSKRDGRLKISLKETEGKGYLAKTLGATLLRRPHINRGHHDAKDTYRGSDTPLQEDQPPVRPGISKAETGSSLAASIYDERPIPRLKIVIMVIGSRGDIQPFIRLGKALKEEHGHQVRIATHPAFKDFVEKDSKLEFFSVGGDPSELMAFMVKNPGLIPKPETIRQGEIPKRREAMYEMFQGFWRACINATDDEHDVENLKMMGKKSPFIADAIIANPPSFAHIHCAERLGIPLHLMFTFPTSPTQKFPHPLANIKQSNVDANYTNFMSYPLVEMMQWQGLGDLVNKFRIHTLELEPVSTLWAPGQLFRLEVPHTYLWSPTMIPKPSDWGPEIDITGFVFLDLASSFKPAKELEDFLNSGEPPVYIGFGSIVVDDPDKFTKLIFEAVDKAGVRALVSKGWGGLGEENGTPENIYMLGNTPHDWLFPRVSAVVHHGGAGTTAIGMKCGKPTMIVPFFGDQPFWGAQVHAAGAGAKPIPYKNLTSDNLAESIKELCTPEKQKSAQALSRQIDREGDGALNAVKSFHRSLPLRGNHSMRCSILEDRVAVWFLKGRHVRLSAIAAEILVEKKRIQWSDLKLIRHYEWTDFEGPGEPITGAGSAVSRNIGRIVLGVGSTPFKLGAIAKNMKEKKSHTSVGGSQADPQVTSENDSGKEKSYKENTSKSTQNRTGHTQASSLPIGNTAGKPLTEEMSSSRNTGPGLESYSETQASLDRKSKESTRAEMATEAKEGFAESGKGIANLPLDISLALAQGFHNAPRLWGDDTVRPPTRVTGIKSGFRAAGKEFAFGVYDGWTGIVKHPVKGAKEEGVLGFTKGVGKGLGGFVLKDLSAIFGLPAYTMKGVAKELTKKNSPKAFIRRAQILQGREDVNKLSKEELAKVVDIVSKGWKVVELVGKELDALLQSGLKGRVELQRGKKHWKGNAVFENVELTSQALQAYKEGRDFNEVFQQHKREVQKQLGPRKSALQRPDSTTKPQRTTTDNKSAEVAGPETGTVVKDQAEGSTSEAKHHKEQASTARNALLNGSKVRPSRPKHTVSM